MCNVLCKIVNDTDYRVNKLLPNVPNKYFYLTICF